MANQRDITLYEYDATPNDIILNALPIADLAASVVIYLYTILPAAVTTTPDPREIILAEVYPATIPETPNPREIILYEYDATPSDIILNAVAAHPLVVYGGDVTLYERNDYPVFVKNVIITLRDPLVAVPEEEAPPSTSKLKRWTGSEWTTDTMSVYLSGSWTAKTLKRYSGGSWVSA